VWAPALDLDLDLDILAIRARGEPAQLGRPRRPRMERIKPRGPMLHYPEPSERKKVEMRFAHLKAHHGFERMRLRGLSGARDEFYARPSCKT
jgi:hypothetical protein